MGTQVPPSKVPTPEEDRPAPPGKEIETPDDYRKTFKVATKFADPCAAASKASLDCLDRTHYNREECMEFFRAYRECKGKWLEQRREDRRAGRA